MISNVKTDSVQDATVTRNGAHVEGVKVSGFYEIECRDKDGNLKWKDVIKNVVTTEGKNTALTHVFKGSSYSATVRMGLITSAGYVAPDAANTAANIATSGSGNGWEEAPAATCASRGTPTFGAAGSGSLATSSAVSFSIVGTDTIKGIFILITSTAGTAPSSTVGNTNGALYSAGTFTGGDKVVGNGDTLNVTYTATLT